MNDSLYNLPKYSTGVYNSKIVEHNAYMHAFGRLNAHENYKNRKKGKKNHQKGKILKRKGGDITWDFGKGCVFIVALVSTWRCPLLRHHPCSV